MSLEDYYNILKTHDWYYMYSDDHRVWTSGERVMQYILEIAKQSEAHANLLASFEEYVFNRGPLPILKEA